jgi:hypothetical protein
MASSIFVWAIIVPDTVKCRGFIEYYIAIENRKSSGAVIVTSQREYIYVNILLLTSCIEIHLVSQLA